jgi:hypothetical protein
MKINVFNSSGEMIATHHLTKFPATIGRKAPADLIIDDVKVSGTHVRISFEDGKYFLQDLESRNGVVLGGEKVIRAQIEFPAVAELGPNIRIEIEADVVSQTNIDLSQTITLQPELSRPAEGPRLDLLGTPKPKFAISPMRHPDLTNIRSGEALPVDSPIPQARSERSPLQSTQRDFFELILDRFEKTDIRVILGVSLGFALILFANQVLVLKWNLKESSLNGLGLFVAVWLLSLIGASIGALPGWLVAGNYRLKPLFNTSIVTSYLGVVIGRMIMPYANDGRVLQIAILLIICPMLAFSFFISFYSFLMTFFSRSRAKPIGWVVAVLAVLCGAGASKLVIFRPHEQVATELFKESDPNIVRLSAGKAVSSADVANQLREFASRTGN